MEIHERIKELRKKHLKMSQTAFGERLASAVLLLIILN